MPARLHGVKEDTGAHIEVLLKQEEGDKWETLVKPAKRVKEGTVISLAKEIKSNLHRNCRSRWTSA